MEKNTTGRLIAATATESADIVYGSGFFAPDEYIYAEIDGEKYVFVSVLELARARQEAAQNAQRKAAAQAARQKTASQGRAKAALSSRQGQAASAARQAQAAGTGKRRGRGLGFLIIAVICLFFATRLCTR